MDPYISSRFVAAAPISRVSGVDDAMPAPRALPVRRSYLVPFLCGMSLVSSLFCIPGLSWAISAFSVHLERASTEYLEAADSDFLSITGDLTIELWVKLDSQPFDTSLGAFTLFSKWDEFGFQNRRSYALRYQDNLGTKQLMFTISANGASEVAFVTVDATLVAGVWSHVAVVYDAGAASAEFFVNGVSVGPTSGSGLPHNIFDSSDGGPVRIGAERGTNAPARFIDGLIDDVRLWATKRTEGQINVTRFTELTGTETDLRGYWPLNGSLLDGTANGNDLVGIPTGATFSPETPLYQCGNGFSDPGEECDDQNVTDGDGCSSGCMRETCYACSGVPSQCTQDLTDVDLDGVCNPDDNCPTISNPDQADIDGDRVGDLCDQCLTDSTNTCDPNRSAATTIDSSGGSLMVPDGTVVVSVPPGALSEPVLVSVMGGLPDSAFGVRTGEATLLIGRFQPEGVTFDVPVTVTFSWPDADNDGLVDSASEIREEDLRVWRNGEPITDRCADQSPSPAASCDTAANTWTIQVTGFSEYVLGRPQCSAVRRATLKIGKLGGTPGDETLTFKGETTLPTPFNPQIDLVATGLRLIVRDAQGDSVLDALVPGGAYSSLRKVGWRKVGASLKWIYRNPTGLDGIRRIVVSASSRHPGLVGFVVTGKAASYPLVPAHLPVQAELSLDPVSEAAGQCAIARFPGPRPSPACLLNGKGSTLTCR